MLQQLLGLLHEQSLIEKVNTHYILHVRVHTDTNGKNVYCVRARTRV